MKPEPSAYPSLRFLNASGEIHKSRNRLPHWQQDNSTYFITFRLGDSIPATVLHQWKSERDLWRTEHPQPWSPATEMEYHRLFSTTIDRHLDQGHGSCIFREPSNANIVSDAFKYFNSIRYLLHAWVIMPNHVHLLLSLKEGESLESIVASWKRFTANQIHGKNGTSGNLWQKDYFDRLIRDWDHFMNVARYIRRNPTKAKLAEQNYLHTEAAWVRKLLS